MIALSLLLAAQAAAPAPDAAPASTPSPVARVCRKAPGSEQIVCSLAPQQQLGYRLPRYGPAAPGAQSKNGVGVRIRGQATNRGRAGRNRSMATVGIPF